MTLTKNRSRPHHRRLGQQHGRRDGEQLRHNIPVQARRGVEEAGLVHPLYLFKRRPCRPGGLPAVRQREKPAEAAADRQEIRPQWSLSEIADGRIQTLGRRRVLMRWVLYVAMEHPPLFGGGGRFFELINSFIHSWLRFATLVGRRLSFFFLYEYCTCTTTTLTCSGHGINIYLHSGRGKKSNGAYYNHS